MLGVQILLGGIVHMVIQPNMQQLTDEVRDGKLDFALTKPEDSQLIVSLRSLSLWQFTESQRRDRDRRRARAARRALDAAPRPRFFGLLASARSSSTASGSSSRPARSGSSTPGSSRTCSRASTRSGAGRSASTRLAPLLDDVPRADRLRGDRAGAGGDAPAALAHGRIALAFAVVLAAFTRWFWRFGLRRYSGRVGLTADAPDARAERLLRQELRHRRHLRAVARVAEVAETPRLLDRREQRVVVVRRLADVPAGCHPCS